MSIFGSSGVISSKFFLVKRIFIPNISDMVSITCDFFPRVKKLSKWAKMLLSGRPVTTMQAQIEQRSNVKMLTFLGKSQAEIHRTLTAAYGDLAMSLSQVRMWFLWFKEDPEAPVSDQPHPGMERKGTQDQKVIQFLQTDKGQL